MIIICHFYNVRKCDYSFYMKFCIFISLKVIAFSFLYGRIDQERKKEMKINQETLSKYLGQQISTTNDPKKFGNYYDQAIAKIQLEEFGVIYYYSKLLEPVEPDDIYRLLEG